MEASHVFLILAIIIYLIPMIVANKRNHKNTLAISVTNLLLGWTVLGWIIALIWACTSDVAPEAAREKRPSLWEQL